MKVLNVLRLMVSIVMLSVVGGISAQSNGDKLFMEGQKLQQTQTIASQNQAIKKFQAAKVIYATADKKTMCDNQIAICNNNIASLKRGTKSVSKKQEQTVATEPVNELSLSRNRLEFDGDKAGAFNVAVNASSLDWSFNIPEGIEGEENFAKVNRSNDAKSIDIEVEANPLTIKRQQSIYVTHGAMTEVILVVQNGKSVTLSTSSNLIEYGLKGGNKSIEVYTNSDSTIVSNNEQTWYVESKPDWVEVGIEVKKNKGVLGKGLSAIKGFVAGTATASTAEDAKTSTVKVVALPLIKSDPEYETGRRGEIVFVSQDKRYKVIVIQQK